MMFFQMQEESDPAAPVQLNLKAKTFKNQMFITAWPTKMKTVFHASDVGGVLGARKIEAVF